MQRFSTQLTMRCGLLKYREASGDCELCQIVAASCKKGLHLKWCCSQLPAVHEHYRQLPHPSLLLKVSSCMHAASVEITSAGSSGGLAI